MAQTRLNGTLVEYNNIYYIAVDGNDTTGDGTKGNPFATYNKACSVALSGDLIYFIKGNYINQITKINNYEFAALYDLEKQLIIYAEPFTYIKIDNPAIGYSYIHSISIRNLNTQVIGFIIDWNVTNKSVPYERSIFGNISNLRGFIYNCHFIIRSATSFSFTNGENILQCINCQFNSSANFEGAWKGATKFVNCTINKPSKNTGWGFTNDSTLLVNQSYTDKYELVIPNFTYGIYNGLYKYSFIFFLIFNNDKYKYADENNNVIVISNISDLLNVFDIYGMTDFSKINPINVNTLDNDKFNIKLLK